MDPLSDVLALLKPRNFMSAGFDAGGAWSVQFPDQRASIKTGAVVSGGCWLAVDGVAEAVRLETGDCFLLPSGRPFRMARDLTLPSSAAEAIFAGPRVGGIVTHQGGGDCLILSSRFALDGDNAGLLLGLLPPIVHLSAGSGHATLCDLVERMMRELRAPQPGGALVLQYLAHMMLIEALRLHLADQGQSQNQGGVGWLFALADKTIGAAIVALHADPARRWTLQALAEHVGMSRSSFALRFRDRVGATPMDYLTRWRMLLAAEQLARTGAPISVVAAALGYWSESAFSAAFKRVMGCSPRQYGRRDSAEASIPASA